MDEALKGSLRAEVRAQCLDLSEGGALLFLPTALGIGEIADFALEIDERTVWVQAEVRHLRLVERAGAEGYEVGVHFVGLDPHDERCLREYLARAGAAR
jgi:c-di-GMP-binding flagellar brake protein YcgR